MESSPSRICIDARFYRRSTAGVGRYTRGLIHHLQKIDPLSEYTVILTPADYTEWPKTGTPKNWHIKVLDVPIYSLAEQTQLLNYLQNEKFDLVHFTMFNHPIRYRGKWVVTIHDLTMNLFPLRPRLHPRMWAYLYVMKHAAEKSHHIIVPSQHTKTDIHRYMHIPNDKMTVTLEAVEPEFRPQHNKQVAERLRKKYGLTKPFLFFVNSWRPHKGLPDLVQAFLKARREVDMQLLISGKPNPAFPTVIESVESAKAQSDDILTPGFIPDEDMIPLYSLASAFVFTSHYEGFGLGPLEAIACGAPTICARNSSLPEVLGDAALYYETGDITALAEQIVEVMQNQDLREKLRRDGLEQAKRFSFDKMAHETLAVYRKTL